MPLGLLTDGDSWSEHSLLNRHRSPISVVALSPVTVLSVYEQDLWSLITAQPRLGERVIARSATSADHLALPFLRVLMHLERAGTGVAAAAAVRGMDEEVGEPA